MNQVAGEVSHAPDMGGEAGGDSETTEKQKEKLEPQPQSVLPSHYKTGAICIKDDEITDAYCQDTEHHQHHRQCFLWPR